MWDQGSPGGLVVRNPFANAGNTGKHGFDPWVGKVPWRRNWKPTPVSLPGGSHEQRSLAGCSPWGHKESGMAEHEHTRTCGIRWVLPMCSVSVGFAASCSHCSSLFEARTFARMVSYQS